MCKIKKICLSYLDVWLTFGLLSLFCGASLTDNRHVFSPSLSVVPYWLWFGEEVPRQPNTTAHPLQRRQEPDWHSTLCLHQCAPGNWTEVCADIWYLIVTDYFWETFFHFFCFSRQAILEIKPKLKCVWTWYLKTWELVSKLSRVTQRNLLILANTGAPSLSLNIGIFMTVMNEISTIPLCCIMSERQWCPACVLHN